MLSPGALLKFLTRRFLPSPSPEGAESEGYLRGLRYGEAAAGSLVRKSHLLADEGSYFVVNNAQTGIVESNSIAFVITLPTLYVANNADPGDPTAKSIGMDYVDLSVQTIGLTATAVTIKNLAVYLDKGNNYASGGTDLTSKIVNVNPRVQGASVAKAYFGAVTTTTPTVVKGTTRPIVGFRSYRLPVTATTVPENVGDRLRLEFGSVEAEAPVQLGTTGALQANVFQTVMKLPAVLIPPGWSMALYTWTNTTTYTTGVTWLPEAGWWER